MIYPLFNNFKNIIQYYAQSCNLTFNFKCLTDDSREIIDMWVFQKENETI